MGSRSGRVPRTTLSRATCLDLLRRADLARVVISVRCLPAALPARIEVVDDGLVLLASTEEAVLVAARRGEVLSVQIDGLEESGATWSVMASGLAGPAEESAVESPALAAALANGASLVALPLAVVVGERVG
jgi:nitroimidazol reductase NimA-like FMN-containing flavoprotein (pyridoxamine 5'-phosphate oxidase superfamily)